MLAIIQRVAVCGNTAVGQPFTDLRSSGPEAREIPLPDYAGQEIYPDRFGRHRGYRIAEVKIVICDKKYLQDGGIKAAVRCFSCFFTIAYSTFRRLSFGYFTL